MKSSVRWFLFEYQGRKLADFVNGFKTKELAEKARLKISRKCASEDRNRRSSRNQ